MNRPAGSSSPLRQRSRGSTDGGGAYRHGAQTHNVVETRSNNHSSLRQNTEANNAVSSPAPKNAFNLGRVSITSAEGHKSPYGPGADVAAQRHHSELERLFHNQLEEKEGVVRQQQSTIQELRVQLTGDTRNMQNRIDELNDKMRVIERERNDLRTRLAAELRNYQISKEELSQKNR